MTEIILNFEELSQTVCAYCGALLKMVICVGGCMFAIILIVYCMIHLVSRLSQIDNPKRKYYKVQIGAFTEYANAEKLKAELKAKGYDAFIKEE